MKSLAPDDQSGDGDSIATGQRDNLSPFFRDCRWPASCCKQTCPEQGDFRAGALVVTSAIRRRKERGDNLYGQNSSEAWEWGPPRHMLSLLTCFSPSIRPPRVLLLPFAPHPRPFETWKYLCKRSLWGTAYLPTLAVGNYDGAALATGVCGRRTIRRVACCARAAPFGASAGAKKKPARVGVAFINRECYRWPKQN